MTQKRFMLIVLFLDLTFSAFSFADFHLVNRTKRSVELHAIQGVDSLEVLTQSLHTIYDSGFTQLWRDGVAYEPARFATGRVLMKLSPNQETKVSNVTLIEWGMTDTSGTKSFDFISFLARDVCLLTPCYQVGRLHKYVVGALTQSEGGVIEIKESPTNFGIPLVFFDVKFRSRLLVGDLASLQTK